MTIHERLQAENVVLCEIDFQRALGGDTNEELPISATNPKHPYHLAAIVEFTIINKHLKDLEWDCVNDPVCPTTLSALERLSCDLAVVAQRIREAWGYQQ